MADIISLEQKLVLHGSDMKRLTIIMLVLFVFEVSWGISLYFIHPSQEVSDFFEKLPPDRVAKLVIKKKEEPKPIESGAGVASKASKKEEAKAALAEKAGERLKERASTSVEERRQAGAASRSMAREKAAAAVSNVGALAILSSVRDEGSSDEPVEDVLGSSNVSGADLSKSLSSVDIDAVVKSSSGLTTRGGGARGSRGSAGGAGGAGGSAVGVDLLSGVGSSGPTTMKRKGTIELSKPEQVTGQAAKSAGRAYSDINAVIQEKLGAIQFCFKKELRKDPSLSGKITVKFTVEASGRVTNAMVVNTSINNEGLQQCLLKTINMLVFKSIPESQGSMTVTYPFVFAPE
jgi:TonB family protein